MQRVSCYIKHLCQKKTSRVSFISRAGAFDTREDILILQRKLSTVSQTIFENKENEKTPSDATPESPFFGHSWFLKSIDLSNPSDGDRKKFLKIIQEVVKTKSNSGDFVPQIVIEELCRKFRAIDITGKKQMLLIISRDLHIDISMAKQSTMLFNKSLEAFQSSQNQQEICWEDDSIERYLRSFRNLRQALVPFHEVFFQQILSQKKDGMMFLIQMRADLLQVLRKDLLTGAEAAALRSLDHSLKTFLSFWFSVGFLKLERVTYERSPGQLLEKIIRYEAVHPVGTIIELKRRLGRGRRCFAFFHPSVPDEPLVFVHVALVKTIAASMNYIREETEHLTDESGVRAAIFYSISSTQKGLQGIDLGNFLIKEVAKALKNELPQLDTFSTLSPIPQFVEWLTSRAARSSPLLENLEREHLRTVLQQFTEVPPVNEDISGGGLILKALEVKDWQLNPELSNLLKPVLLRLAANYIFKEKKRGKALCQVANFHIRNGAIFERVNWLADVTPKGLRQSAGLMVNYKYDLEKVETNNENYLLKNEIAIGAQPLDLLASNI